MSESGAPRWAAVIVNYNAGSHLAACVASVLADDSAGPVEVIVVDNASTDDSLAAIAHLPITVIDSGSNRGLAGAANLGMAATRAPFVAVLNPDTKLHPGAAATLLAQFDVAVDRDRARTAAVGPRIEQPDGSVYPSARREPGLAVATGHALLGPLRPSNRFTREYRELDAEPSAARAVDWLSGAAIWFRRRALDDIGGWDERYFMFMEDVDVCRRLRDAGWHVVYEPAATVMHVEGVSRAHHPYRMIAAHHRSVWRYADRHWRGPRRALLPFVGVALAARAGLTMIGRGAGARRKRREGAD